MDTARMANVRGRWLDRPSTWRRIALNTWSHPDDPTIYGVVEVDVSALDRFLEERSEASGVKCTLTHAVTRAVAMTLARHPDCNVLVRGHRIWVREDVDIFLQVAMPSSDGGGKADLSGATLRRVDRMAVEEIAAELGRRARAVRERKDGSMARTRGLLDRLPRAAVRHGLDVLGFLQYDLNLKLPGTPKDPFGGAMVTSVGSLGIATAFAPIVTFSRCPIVVAVGEVQERAVVRDGAVAARPMCSITASIDHRIMDGFQAGRLARELRLALEEPERLDDDVTARR